MLFYWIMIDCLINDINFSLKSFEIYHDIIVKQSLCIMCEAEQIISLFKMLYDVEQIQHE